MLASPGCLDQERVIGHRLHPFLAELRLTDLIVFVDHVVNRRDAAIAEIVSGAAELHFAPGFLRYDDDASVKLCWDRQAEVALSIVLAAARFTAHLRVALRTDHAGIQLQALLRAPGLSTIATIDEPALARAFAHNRLGPARGAAPQSIMP